MDDAAPSSARRETVSTGIPFFERDGRASDNPPNVMKSCFTL